MRNYFLLLLICLFLAACTKKTGNTTEQQLRTENFNLKQENDSLKRLLAQNEAPPIKADTLSKVSEPAAVASGAPKLPGKHALTLQWISWDHPGSVMITETDTEWYKISGQQVDKKNSRNYLKINGRIKPLSERELEFDGTIETKVETINEGKPCIRTGRKIFKATGSRKYWRLQDMINCEGGMVTDYVDIYF